jgi:hypothetical protein
MVLDRSRSIITVESYWVSHFAFGHHAPETLTVDTNEAQLELYNNRPDWYMFNFAIAVLAGTLSCILCWPEICVDLFFLLVSVLISLYGVFWGIGPCRISDKTLFY